MLERRLSVSGLEEVYDLIAEGIDRAGSAKAKVFLAKLSLALANLLGDLPQVKHAVEASLRDL